MQDVMSFSEEKTKNGWLINYRNITWNDSFGTTDQTEITNIISDFRFYADPPMDNCLIKDYDSTWANKIICGIASKGFNHIKNSCDFRNKKMYKGQSIEIVEGFLVLATNNGQFNLSTSDTVEEMYEQFYSVPNFFNK
jgi:hypothetical protein